MSKRGSLPGVAICAIAALAVACTSDDDQPARGQAVQALGAPPINTLPAPQTANEDSPLFFSSGAGNPISVSDADNTVLTVQLIATNGTLLLDPNLDRRALAVSGDGTASITVVGPVTAINAGALEGLRFRPALNYNGPASLQLNSSDNNGESDNDTLAITVTPFNDPPVNVVPTTVQAATEDVPRAFTLSVTDVDVAGAPVLVSLAASNATLITLPTVSGLSFSAGDGTDDASMTFTGTLPDINAALNGLVITPPLNYIGASTLQVTSNDQGASGAGMAGADNDTVDITWAAVNDAPVNQAPGAQVLTEDTSLTFSAGTGNPLGVTDVDASTALLQVTLSASSGALTLGNPGAVTFTSGDGTADPSMTFSGTLAALASALGGTVYTPGANVTGAVTLTMTSNDLGNTGSGGAKVDTDLVALTINAVNDPPANGVPGAQVTNEDVARIFSTAGGNPITVSDPDATSLQVTLTATGGTVTLGARTGLTFQAGDGVADTVTTFTGTITTINTSLAGTSFVPGANFAGAASLRIVTSDLGATGAGGALTDDDTITITVNPGNDPPTAGNDSAIVAEDSGPTLIAVLGNDGSAPDVGETLSVLGVGTALHGVTAVVGDQVSYTPAADYNGPDSFAYTVSDGNGGTASASVTITVTPVNDPPTASADSVSVISDSGGNSIAVLTNDSAAPDTGETLTITAVGAPAHGTATVTAAGTRITYTPDPGYSGPDAFTYTIGDGNGGTASTTVTIDVVGVITRPVNALPSPQTLVEDSPLFFSSAAGNPITVSDANNPSLTVQVLVTSGTFSLGTVTNLTVSGNGTAAVTLSGTIAAINTGLNGARYNPAADYFGPATLTINTSDSTGESDLDNLTLTVTSFNDAPVNVAPTGVQAATEDTPRTFSTISISDVDLSGAELVVSLTANNGTLVTLATTTGLVFSSGDGTRDAAMTFTGTLAAVNVALNGLTITAPADYIGPSTLVITSNDQRNTGAGVAGQDTDTISLSWAAVNDPPVNTVPGPQTLAEDGALVFAALADTALTVSDADAAAGTIQVTLTGASGVITLGNPAGVTFTAGDGNADPTMTFRGTIGAINGALEGTSFAPTANFTGNATVTMATSDLGNTGGAAATDTDAVTVTVTAVNDAPVIAAPASQTTNEDVARVLSSAQGNPITVTDVDATAVQVTLTASAGAVTLANTNGLTFQAGDGTADATMTFLGAPAALNTALNGLSFRPAAQFYGTATLEIAVSDLGATGVGGPRGDARNVVFTVNPVNDPPDAIADTLTTSEDAPVSTVDVLANDTILPDVGETLTITAVSAGARGATAIVPGGTSVTYTPAANAFGTDTFTYTISDGNGGTDTASVTVTITGVNDPPTVNDDTVTVAESSSTNNLPVRANDSAAPDTGETLTITAITPPAHGTAVITGAAGASAIIYTPTAGYNGPDSLRYTMSDGNGGSASATVTITVTSVDTQPVAVDDTLTVVEDGSATVTVLGNDTGLGDLPLTVTITTPPARGTAAVQADNRVLYTPAPDYAGADSFAYTVTDGDGDADAGQVNVTVTGVDDQPTAVADTLTVIEDTATALAVLGNDTGVGDAPLTVTVTTAPMHGTTTVAAGVITYTPAADYAGADVLTYRVTDADGDQASAQVALTVTPVDDPPRAVDDTVSTRVGEGRVLPVLANDVDPDGDVIAITAVSTPTHGTATIQAGAVNYLPAAGYTGDDSFTYTISDGDGPTATATVFVGVGIDTDGDGLVDLDEQEAGTDPADADSDDDLLSDGAEVRVTGTSPRDSDSDDDGLLDGNEDTNASGVVDPGETAATNPDTDGDQLGDGLELGLTMAQGTQTAGDFVADADPETTTDPTRADTDGGGVPDGVEDANHNGKKELRESDPNDPSDDEPVDGGGGDDGGGCDSGGGGAQLGLVLALVLAVLVRTRRGPQPARVRRRR